MNRALVAFVSCALVGAAICGVERAEADPSLSFHGGSYLLDCDGREASKISCEISTSDTFTGTVSRGQARIAKTTYVYGNDDDEYGMTAALEGGEPDGALTLRISSFDAEWDRLALNYIPSRVRVLGSETVSNNESSKTLVRLEGDYQPYNDGDSDVGCGKRRDVVYAVGVGEDARKAIEAQVLESLEALKQSAKAYCKSNPD